MLNVIEQENENAGMIRIAALHHDSQVNGPGLHSIIHFQGCSLHCNGCFNPSLQPLDGGTLRSPRSLIDDIIFHDPRPRGVVISGGEPLLQPEGLKELLVLLKKFEFPVILYSGFSVEGIRSRDFEEIVSMADLLLAGPYVPGKETDIFPYTSSKVAVFISPRYHPDDFKGLKRFEARVTPGGVSLLGFPSPGDMKRVGELLSE